MTSLNPMVRVFQAATTPGPQLQPDTLLATLKAYRDPVGELASDDVAARMWEVLRDAFPAVDCIRMGASDIEPAELDQWASLIRWLFAAIEGWSSADDPHDQLLAAVLLTSSYCDIDQTFWALALGGAEPNEQFLEELEKRLRGLRVEFEGRLGLSQRDLIEQLRVADSAEDWQAIDDLWIPLESAFVPHPVVPHIVRCLYGFGQDGLLRATRKFATPLAMQVADALPPVQRLTFAVKSENPHLQFASAVRTLFHCAKNERLDREAQDALAELLEKVARDRKQWHGWMAAFNRYPIRYPALQVALGKVLARCGREAVEIYVNSIHLTVSCSEGRESVAECLEVFRHHASESQRRELWQLAYQRWSDWNFGAGLGSHLLNIVCSELDYAIVGYACECLSSVDCEAIVGSTINTLKTVNRGWYESVIDATTAWNRTLSALQPYAYALSAGASDSWLFKRHHVPEFDAASQAYFGLMYRVPGRIGISPS